MKTLHLARHGKSSWDMLGVSDLDRPLLEKGISNTMNMGITIEKKFGKPGLIITSPANRAIHTAIIFARSMNMKMQEVKINEKLYETDASTIIEIIEETNSKIDNLLIVGHNPTFTNLANLFLPSHIENLPTSGVVTIRFDSKSWNIINKTPIFTEVDFPKKE
jgi:phosphohistidine phosphatase